jgi:hypothetical protein
MVAWPVRSGTLAAATARTIHVILELVYAGTVVTVYFAAVAHDAPFGPRTYTPPDTWKRCSSELRERKTGLRHAAF